MEDFINQNDQEKLDDQEQLEELDELEELGELENQRNSTISLDHLHQDFPDVNMDIPSMWQQPLNPFQPLFLMDINMQIIWCNQALIELFGSRELQDVTYLNHLLKLPQGDETYQKMILSLKKRDHNFYWHSPLEIILEHRGMCHLNLIILPGFIEHNHPQNFLGILEDQTAHQKSLIFRTFQSLLEASMLKDNDTGSHIKRVNAYSHFLANLVKKEKIYTIINRAYIEDISYLAAMHDVGKIGTPDDILNKKYSLEDWERKIMNEHTTNGAFIMNNYPNPMAKDIALNHHERWDGSGYPYGKEKEMIPLSARIVSIADVYDALRSKRSYKDGWTHQEAVKAILDGSGTQFDPELIKLFKNHHEEFNSIWNKLQD